MPSATTDACTPPTVRPSAEFSGACAASTPPIADATTSATVRSMPRHTSGMSLTLGTRPARQPAGGRLQLRLGRRARPPPVLRALSRAACARSSATASCSTPCAAGCCTSPTTCRGCTCRSSDLDAALLEPSDTRPTARSRATRPTARCASASGWSRTPSGLYEQPIEAAAWLEGFASLYWDKADAWFVEDERLSRAARPLPPRRRVRDLAAVRVTAGGEVVARVRAGEAAVRDRPGAARLRAGRATSPPARSPRRPSARPARTRARRPTGTSATIADGAWSYESPLPESLAVARARVASTARASRSSWPSRPTASRSRRR